MSTSQKMDLETFKIIVETVFEADNPETMGSQLTRLLIGGMDIKGTAFFIVNPIKEELELLCAEGLSSDYKRKGPVIVDKSISLVANQEPVIIEDTFQTDLLQYPENAQDEGIRSIISLPIKLKGKIIGALRLYHSEPWQVSLQDLGYLTLLTKNIAMALKYFRLAAAVKSAKESLEGVHSIWL